MQTEIHHCAASHGATLYYEVTGQGHPLVLLHGNGEDSTYFEHQVPVFSQLYQVIAIDTRAHGRSTRGNAPLDFYLFADDVIAVLDDLGLQKAHILGFSDGGNIALHTVLKYPERVLSVIADGANLFPAGLLPEIQAHQKEKYAFLCEKAKTDLEYQKKAEIYGLMIHHPNLTFDMLAQIHTPTMILAGEHDMIAPAHTQGIAEAIEGAELFIVADGDHFIAAKMPDVFNALVMDFLQAQG